MKNIKLKEDKQRKIKGLSKAISILAKIGKVISIIGCVCVLIAMIVIPIVFSKIDIKDNSITINNKANIEFVEDEKGLSLKYDGEVIAVEEDKDAILQIKDILQNNSKTFIVSYIEFTCLVAVAILVLTILVLRHLDKLFKNIHDGETPFTLENVDHIKKMAYMLIIAIVIPFVIGSIFELIFRQSLDISMNFTNVMEILFLFSLAYIFEYGYEIQQDSKGKMYGEIKE